MLLVTSDIFQPVAYEFRTGSFYDRTVHMEHHGSLKFGAGGDFLNHRANLFDILIREDESGGIPEIGMISDSLHRCGNFLFPIGSDVVEFLKNAVHTGYTKM